MVFLNTEEEQNWVKLFLSDSPDVRIRMSLSPLPRSCSQAHTGGIWR